MRACCVFSAACFCVVVVLAREGSINICCASSEADACPITGEVCVCLSVCSGGGGLLFRGGHSVLSYGWGWLP